MMSIYKGILLYKKGYLKRLILIYNAESELHMSSEQMGYNIRQITIQGQSELYKL